MREIRLTLGWPPTGNLNWRHAKGRWHKSAAFAAYLRDTQARVLVARTPTGLGGRLSVTIDLHPPNRIRRDLDNLAKTIQDALTKAGVWTDDSLIDELHLYRRETTPGGSAHVVIRLLG